jgi:hypothetical protein
VHVQAETGARPSQTVRLRVEDLILDPRKPKLMMPRSGKGGGRRRSEKKLQQYAVPVTSALALKLKAAAKGRAPHEPLLLRSTGKPWGSKNINILYCRDIRKIVESIGFDAVKVTIYALRHSSITRQLSLEYRPGRLYKFYFRINKRDFLQLPGSVDPISANLTVTEAADVAAATGTVVSPATSTLTITETADTAAGTGMVGWLSALAAVETADAAAIIGSVFTPVIATLGTTEAADTAAGKGSAKKRPGQDRTLSADQIAQREGGPSTVGNRSGLG